MFAVFFFNDTATTEIYTLSLHDALPICKHASVYDVAQRLPHYAGRLVARELEVLQRLTTDPERPYVVVLGGSKVSDKLAVIEALLPKVDRSEEHTSELQSRQYLVCRLLLE